jgi:hypothetical protein
MMMEIALIPGHRTVRWCDLAAAALTAVFATLGVLTGVQLAGLAEVHSALLQAAHALGMTAQAVALVDDVPFIGDDAGRLADSVRATAAEVRTSAADIRDDLRTLGLLIGVVIAAIPIVPLILLYVPFRLARLRELRRLRLMLAEPAEPALVAQLAVAAVHRIPYRELRQVSPHPWLDLHEGRHAHLAAAELHRLGVRPPAWLGPAHG